MFLTERGVDPGPGDDGAGLHGLLGVPVAQGADAATMAPRTLGGPGKNGVVNPKGKNVDESLKYIKWLTEKEQEQTFMEMVPLVPTNPAALDPAKISPQIARSPA